MLTRSGGSAQASLGGSPWAPPGGQQSVHQLPNSICTHSHMPTSTAFLRHSLALFGKVVGHLS